MEMLSIEKELQSNSYPGRGIIIGKSADGSKAVTAYFIMGSCSDFPYKPDQRRAICWSVTDYGIRILF